MAIKVSLDMRMVLAESRLAAKSHHVVLADFVIELIKCSVTLRVLRGALLTECHEPLYHGLTEWYVSQKIVQIFERSSARLQKGTPKSFRQAHRMPFSGTFN